MKAFILTDDSTSQMTHTPRINRGAYHSQKSVWDFCDFKNHGDFWVNLRFSRFSVVLCFTVIFCDFTVFSVIFHVLTVSRNSKSKNWFNHSILWAWSLFGQPIESIHRYWWLISFPMTQRLEWLTLFISTSLLLWATARFQSEKYT